MKKRSLILALSVAACLVLAGFGYTQRRWLLETWHLFRLERAEGEERKEVVGRLAAVGGARSAVRLLELAREEALEEEALDALRPVLIRIGSRERLRLLGPLFDLPRSPSRSFERYGKLLLEVGKARPDTLPVFFEAFRRKEFLAWQVASKVFLDHLESEPSARVLLEKSSPEELVRFFLPACLPPQRRHMLMLSGGPLPDPPFEKALDLAAKLRAHADPRTRAVAMSFQVCLGLTGNDFQYDSRPLEEAFSGDPSPLVKTAAIRISGFLGPGQGLDLPGILLDEEDPALLTEAIQARTLWSAVPGETPDGLELWDGFACSWIPWPHVSPTPFTPEEVERLRRVLAGRREAGLRDAASLALASRYPDMRNHGEARPGVRAPGFKVHEWGVWREGDGVLLPAESSLDDLPPFVHRNQVGPARILAGRTYSPSVVFKPVVYFHAPEPLAVLFQVDFHEGMPWTWFPAATDLTQSFAHASSGSPGARGPAGKKPPSRGPFASSLLAVTGSGAGSGAGAEEDRVALDERTGLLPPWLAGEQPGPFHPSGDFPEIPDTAAVNPPDLRDFYMHAPWIIPGHPRDAMANGGGTLALSGLGLEWCGLRVGYPPELEGSEPPVDTSSWWARLRGSASPVAARGERERFLFYDGAVNLPGPVKAAWADPSRKELLLAVRPFHEFPDIPGSVLDLWWLSDPEKERLRTTHPIPAALVIAVEAGGKGRGEILERLEPLETPLRLSLDALPLGKADLRRRLGEVVAGEGLTPEEAAGLLSTWEKEFFDTPGLRVITVLPRWIYNAILPARVFPVPDEFARVGLVWRECQPEKLPVGAEALEIRKRTWEPEPWPVSRERVEIAREALPAASRRPLERGEDGEIKHGSGKIGQPAISSDGSRVAFAVLEASQVRIHLADLRDGVLEEVHRHEIAGRREPGSVSISGDGRRLAFLTGREGERSACVADLAARTLLELPSSGHPRISGDGRKVLLQEWLKNGEREVLRLLDLETAEAITVFEEDAPSGLISNADLSADGGKVAFAFEAGINREVYLVDVAKATILNVSQSPGADDFPTLSADGGRVFFESERTLDSDLFLADLEARTLTNLTGRPGEDRFAEVAADGRRLIYREWETGFLAFDLPTGEKKPVPGTRQVWTAAISDDGKKAAVLRWCGESWCLCVVDIGW